MVSFLVSGSRLVSFMPASVYRTGPFGQHFDGFWVHRSRLAQDLRKSLFRHRSNAAHPVVYGGAWETGGAKIFCFWHCRTPHLAHWPQREHMARYYTLYGIVRQCRSVPSDGLPRPVTRSSDRYEDGFDDAPTLKRCRSHSPLGHRATDGCTALSVFRDLRR